MNSEDKQGYNKLLDELAAMAARLEQISEASFGDMEGADYKDFLVAESLYADLEDAAKVIRGSIEYCRKVVNAPAQ